MESSALLRDIIRVTPTWHNRGPRFDFVLLNKDHNTISCAQVMAIFVIKIGSIDFPLALVQVIRIRPRSANTGFYEGRFTSDLKFVPPGSFIRSVYVQYNPSDEEPRLFINDLIDSDVYLRLRNANLNSLG